MVGAQLHGLVHALDGGDAGVDEVDALVDQGMRILLTTKPGASLTSTGSLPSSEASAAMVE